MATGHPRAAEAAVKVLRAGGSAVDAALAADAVMGVAEPTSTGIGGDVMCVVAEGDTVTVINGSGRSGRAVIPENAPDNGRGYVISVGGHAVTVPGAIAAWWDLHQRFGRLTWRTVLEPAIAAATDGVKIGTMGSRVWAGARKRLDNAGEALYFATGSAPAPGDTWRNTALASALKRIAANGPDAMSSGRLAIAIAEAVAGAGGVLGIEDLAVHRSEWVEPLRVGLGFHDLVTVPPPCQGVVVALAAESLHRQLTLGRTADTTADITDTTAGTADTTSGTADTTSGTADIIADTVHTKSHNSSPRHGADTSTAKLADALDRAFAVALEAVGDPRHVKVPSYAKLRQRLADAATKGPFPYGPGTVFTAVAAGDQLVALVSSVCDRFGAGVTVPEGGFVLQSRGRGFCLQAGHSNALAPSKRPYHTIVPTVVLRHDRPWLSLGVVGGIMQPQGQLQILHRVLAGETLSSAVNAGRFRLLGHGKAAVEPTLNDEDRTALLSAGYELVDGADADFGSAQAVMITDNPSGTQKRMTAASDPRRDGATAVI